MPLVLGDGHEPIRLISIDPGTLLLGVALFEVSFKQRKIISVSATTWHVEKLDALVYMDEDDHRAVTIRLKKIHDHFCELLKTVSPHVVVCEHPFFNRFKPNAFAAIVRVLECINIAILNYSTEIQIEYLAPMLIKKIVGASLNSDKEKVKEALLAKPELLHLPIHAEMGELGKDAIDALAVGYSFIKNWQEELNFNYSKKPPCLSKRKPK